METNYSRLIELYRHKSVDDANDSLRESFKAGDRLRSDNIDLGRLFEECFGIHEYRACKARTRLATQVMTERLVEGEGAVSSHAFSNITGQIVYNETLKPYMEEEYVFSRLIPEVTTTLLDGEKMAGITEIGDEMAVRAEGDPYALAGVGENWVFTPPVLDRGMIVPVTWEAVFADRTGQLLERAGNVGKWAAVNKEKRAIDAFIDENTTRHRYNWRGTVIPTYGENTGTHTWDNLVGTNGLVDWTDIDTAQQTGYGLIDPFTSEPIAITFRHIVAAKGLEMSVARLMSATEIRTTTPGYATSGNPNQAVWKNPYNGRFEYVTSRLLAARLATDTDWFIADIPAMLRYMVAERINVVQAPPNNHDDFHRRIVQQYRVNERGAFVVVEPRAAIKNTVA